MAEADPSFPTIAPQGEIDAFSSRGLATDLAEAAGRPGPCVLDLTGVTFMDSTGLAVVLKAAARFGRQDKRLVLVAPPGPARSLFDVAGVTGRLTVVDAPPDAAAALA